MKKNSLKLLLIALVFTATSILSVLSFSPSAAAADTYKWGDANHSTIISSSGVTYKSVGYFCSTVEFTGNYSLADAVKPTAGTMEVTYSNESFSGRSQVPACSGGSADNYPAHYLWIAPDNSSYIAVKDGGDNKLTGVGSPYVGKASLWDINGTGRNVAFNSNLTSITKPDNNVPPSTEQTDAAANATLSAADDGCDNALSPFGWVLCPIMGLVDNVYNFFVDLVRQALFFEPEKYNNSQLQEVSRIFVGFANIALVIFALLMIASQIFGFEVFSAYTVKKVLPKILIGAVLIQLSWPIFTLMVQFVNALGTGLYWLMMAPFDVGGSGYVEIGTILSSGSDNQGDAANNAAGLTLGLGALAVGVGAAALTGTWLTIVLAALGVLVSLIVAILTLVVREVVLILLLAIAPLALALWIFPGTQKYWNIWWQSFSKLLLMYPLIMGLMAAGSIAAIILTQSSDPTSGIDLNKVFAIVAYFAPLFLIGATYKFAGQAFGSIATMSNKFGSKAGNSGFFGLRDRAKISRENSEWALGKKRRDSARALSYQQKYANKLAGSGNKFAKQMSGIDEESRKRSASNAVSAISQEKAQQYKDEASLAQYNINRLADQKGLAPSGEGWDYNTVNGQQVATGMSATDKATKWNGMTEYERKEQVRRQIMAAHANGSKQLTMGGQTVDINPELVTQTALQSLANKDDYEDLNTYVSSTEGGNALNDLGTRDGEAFGILAKRAPSIAKGHGSVLGQPPSGNPLQQRGFDDAVKGFGDLGGAQRREVMSTLTTEFSSQPEEVIARLTEIARHSNASATNLEQIDEAFRNANMPVPDLARLRNDPNGILEVDPKTNGFTIVDSSVARPTAPSASPVYTINLTSAPTAPGGAPVSLPPSDVRTQINNSRGIGGVPDDDLINIYNHANTNWKNDAEGTQIGLETLDELRRRGIFPPSP